jgi:hypothetical protein
MFVFALLSLVAYNRVRQGNLTPAFPQNRA